MAVNLSPLGGVAGQFFDNNGDPLSGGKVYTYAAGTTTPFATYTSSTGVVPHTNPIILDAAGRVPGGEIWLTDGTQYKFILKTSADVQLGSYDNILGINANAVNFTNAQEIQTATAGQTVFTLATMQYLPGTNSLSVFVDGVNQYGPGASYAYQETNSTTVTFTSGLHAGASVKFVTSTINASSYGDAEQISYTPPFVSSKTTNVENKLSQYVSVKDFGAVGDGVTDDTAAFVAAQQASKYVWVPPGDYVVTGLRIYDQVNMIGAGYENTRFLQGSPTQPAINCTSDVTVGQLLSLRLENFGVVGHPSSSVAAVKLEAVGVYAIYRSHFDMIITQCYQALNINAPTANNVFYCTFKMDIVNTQTTAVVINGGTYNIYDFFIAQIGNSRMIEHSGFSSTFARLVGEGQIVCTGQNTLFINPTIEELLSPPPTPVGIVLGGFNQTLLNPLLILNPASSANISTCIQTFSGSIVVNPRFLVNGTLNPFGPLLGNTSFTLQGPGQNGCVNKMEVVFDGSDNTKDLRFVEKVGDLSQFITGASTYAGKSVQYQAYPAGVSVNHRILNSTDVMVYDLAGAVTSISVSLAYNGVVRRNGQTLSVYASAAVASITWAGQGSDTSLFPSSLSAGQVVRMVYDAGNNKWYPC